MIHLEDYINNISSFTTSASEEIEHRSTDDCQTEQL